MALSMKTKRSFSHSHQAQVKMCLKNWKVINMAVAPISWPNPMRAIGAQNLLTMPGGVTMSGYLHKKGGSQFSLMKWPLRYIIIHKGCVYYFKTSTSASPQGAFSLNGYNRVMRAAEETTSSNVFPFKIVHYSKKHRTWYFSAASEDERRKWMRNLRKEIDHYNDKDVLDHSESDSDAESFYGAIERPLEITDSTDDPNSEYVMHDEDGYDEDYLIPDEPSGRPKVPPSYPPPPVPSQDREVFISSLSKGPPPPPPNKIPPHPQHLSPSNHGPPPFQKTPPRMSAAPAISPGSQKKLAASSPSLATLPGYDRKPAPSIFINNPSTLPICQGLENKMVLSPADKQCSGNTPSGVRKPNFSTPLGHKPPPTTVPKPPVPVAKSKLNTISIQRSSPDGQSFRSSVEENPLKKRNKAKNNEEGSDDDNDYENVQLPDSVFVNTTETSFVEKLFKETSSSPQDGLYCIRNSGTKTSKVLVVWDVSLNKARNYRIFEGDSIYLEADLPFLSLSELVEFYHSNPLPNHGSLCLQHPYGYTPPR